MSQNQQSLVFIGELKPYLDGLDGDYKVRYERLKVECERYFSMDLPEVHPAKSITYMGINIVNLSLCYVLGKDEKYLNEARRWMKAVLGYEKWGNAHMVNLDLSASWILWGLSLGYDWLQPYLPADEAKAVQDKIAHHAAIMYDHHINNDHGWPVNYGQNHNWINLNGVATAGYVLQKHAGIGAEYTKAAAENFQKVFELMPDDGSNYEGVTYWRYGGMWLFIYAHLAKMHSDVDYFKTCDYLKNTFYYRLYSSAGNMATQLDFGDCHDRYSCHTALVYYKTAAEYNDGYAQHFGNLATTEYLEDEAKCSKVKPGILPEAGLEFIFYSPAVKAKSFDDLPLYRQFKDLGMVSIRSGFTSDDRVFAMKSSYPGGNDQWMAHANNTYPGMSLSLSHHHPDNLSYVFGQGKQYFTREDGYNRNILATDHSVLLVDGQYTDVEDQNDTYVVAMKKRLEANPNLDLKAAFKGSCTDVEEKHGLLTFQGETRAVYPVDLKMKEVSRHYVTNTALDFVVMVDHFDSETPHIFSAVCNTEESMKDNGNGVRTMALGSDTASYAVISSETLEQKEFKHHIEAVMTTQEPDNKCIVDIVSNITQNKTPCTKMTMAECIALSNRSTVTVEDGIIHIKAESGNFQVCLAEKAPSEAGAKAGSIVVGIDNKNWIWMG